MTQQILVSVLSSLEDKLSFSSTAFRRSASLILFNNAMTFPLPKPMAPNLCIISMKNVFLSLKSGSAKICIRILKEKEMSIKIPVKKLQKSSYEIIYKFNND